jgi:hypothetical protein
MSDRLATLLDREEEAPFDWNVNEAQRDFLLTTNTYSCLSGGFGTGKTTVLCEKVALLSMGIPNNLGYLGRLDGKALKQTTMVVLCDMLPRGSFTKNDQAGLLSFKPEYGGSKIVYGDFKDLGDLKNHPLGWFGFDQMEEIPEEVWNYLCGRLRRRTPILSENRQKQYRIKGVCPKAGNGGRHFAYPAGKICEWCKAELPPFDDKPPSAEEAAPWDLIIYRRYGFGVANPEDPQHWIFKDFPHLPGQHGMSIGKPDYAGFSATTYDGLRAGFTDPKYVKDLETRYKANQMMFDRYLLGKWVAAEGLVYPGWKREDNIIDPTAQRWDGQQIIPEGASAYEYIDHGLTSPTAVGWVVPVACECGCNQTDYFIIGEHYVGGRGVHYHASCIKSIRNQLGLPILGTFLDSQAFSNVQTRSSAELAANPKLSELFSYADQYLDEEIFVLPNQKDWDAGYDRITELLATDPDHYHPITGVRGSPHLFVARHCGNFIREIESYKWKKVKASDEWKEEPVDKDDHLMDGLNGFLTTRPAPFEVVKPVVVDWVLRDLEEMDMRSNGHMGA